MTTNGRIMGKVRSIPSRGLDGVSSSKMRIATKSTSMTQIPKQIIALTEIIMKSIKAAPRRSPQLASGSRSPFAPGSPGG